MSGEKHTVVVSRGEVDSYTSRGFAESVDSPRSVMGDLFDVLDKSAQDELVVMRIHKDRFEAKNRLPAAYVLDLPHGAFLATAYVTEVGVQERGHLDSYVAREDGTHCIDTHLLFDTRREAARSGKDEIRRHIELHRIAADGLEEFLRRMEVL